MSGVKSKWRIVNLTNAAAVPPLSVWTPLLFSQASDLQDPNLARIMTRPVIVLVRLIMAFMARCQIYAKHLHELCCPGLAFPKNVAIFVFSCCTEK